MNSLVLLKYRVRQFFHMLAWPFVMRMMSPELTSFPRSSHLENKQFLSFTLTP